MEHNRDNNRHLKYAGNKTYDGTKCCDGEVLAPVLIRRENINNGVIIRDNLVTWHRKNIFGDDVPVLVGFIAVPIEQFDVVVWAYNAQEREYVNNNCIHSCASVSLDKLEEDMEDPDKTVVDFPSTTKYDDAYRAESQMNDFIAEVKRENPVDGKVLEMRKYAKVATRKHIAEVVFEDLGRTQGSEKVSKILKERARQYHKEYDD